MKNIKKVLSTLLALLLMFTMLPFTEINSFAETSGDFEYSVLSEASKTCEITKYKGAGGSLEIPSSINGYTVTSIGSCAFWDCASLTSITIPGSVTSIGDYAFENCTSLESLTIPGSVTSIGDYAFENCTSLESLTIPDNVKSIGYDAFRDCTSLTSIIIGNGVTEIGTGAFENCTSLESLIIPDSVKSIGYLGGEAIVGKGAFYNCTSLKNVVIGSGVIEIGDNTFRDCTALKSVKIPKSVTEIGLYAFNNTPYYNDEANWENGVLYMDNCLIDVKEDTVSGEYKIKPGTRLLANYVFSHCKLLTKAEIPDSVTRISTAAFLECTSLESVSIGKDTIEICYGAFRDCTSLKKVNIMNKGKMNLGNDIFKGCNSLKIYGYSGSDAEIYAKNRDIPFVIISNLCEPGDINGDGKVSAIDARIALQYNAGNKELTAEQLAAADVNGDGKVSAIDARWILQAVAGNRTL